MTTHTQATGDVPQCPSCGQYIYAGPHICQRALRTACFTGGFTMHTEDKLRALITRIAADHEYTGSGHRKRLTRHEMVTLARQVCLEMGWEWSRRDA